MPKLTIEQVEALGGYEIVYSDPNWLYRQQGRGAAENHYRTSSVEKIANLPVSRIAAKNAVLFIWATWPIFIDSDDVKTVIRGWGFTPKTLGFLWVKTNRKAGTPFWGGGSWTRANSEFCLIGVRGDIRRVDKGVHQLIETWDERDDLVLRAPVGEHSAKPPEVRERILKLMGNRPAIELFARCTNADGKVIPGGRVSEHWDQWGDQCDSDVIMDFEGGAGEQVNGSTNGSTASIPQISDININKQESDPMAQLPRDMADSAGKARSAGGGNYFQHGDYVVMLKKWAFQQIQDRVVVTEWMPITSKQKTVYEGDNPVTDKPNEPGSDASYTINYDGEGKLSAPSNHRAIALGLFGLKEGEVKDEVVADTLMQACSDANPAAGMLVGLSTFAKEIRSKKGNYITGMNWIHIAKPGTGVNAPDKVAARLAALARSSEECVKVTLEHLNSAGAAPAFPAAPTAPVVAAPAVAAPALPSATPALPSIPVVDPLAGWTVHPQDPNFYYKGSEVKAKADLLAAAGR